VDLEATACTPVVLGKLKELFEAHPGDAPVRLRFLSSAGVTPLALGTFNVNANGSLLGELGELLGAGATRLDVSG
jgi:DNA polymerase-3 subunit alpha